MDDDDLADDELYDAPFDDLSAPEALGAMVMIVADDEKCACRCGCLRSRTAGALRCADCVHELHDAPLR